LIENLRQRKRLVRVLKNKLNMMKPALNFY